MSVALAGCLFPVLTGCGIARNLATEVRLVREDGPGRDARKGARAAWTSVRAAHPGRAFTAEFRDGFIDGFAGFYGTGAAAEAPPVPPVNYGRYRQYFGARGGDLVRDYYLGFQYGGDVAAATAPISADGPYRPTGPAPAPTVPMKPPAPGPSDSLPIPPPRPVPGNKFGGPKKSDDPPPLLVPPPDAHEPRSVPPLPKPELPIIKPFNPDLTGGGKFAPVPGASEETLLPVPYPALPVQEPPLDPIPVPTDGPKSTIPPLPPLPDTPLVPAPVYKVVLPPLPDAVPTLPAHVPAPLVLEDVPVIPFRHGLPTPIPFTAPASRK